MNWYRAPWRNFICALVLSYVAAVIAGHIWTNTSDQWLLNTILITGFAAPFFITRWWAGRHGALPAQAAVIFTISAIASLAFVFENDLINASSVPLLIVELVLAMLCLMVNIGLRMWHQHE
jgi:hypothetical protein